MNNDDRNRNAAGNWGHCIGTWDIYKCNPCDDWVDPAPNLWKGLLLAWPPIDLMKAVEFSKRASESFKPKKQIRKFEL